MPKSVFSEEYNRFRQLVFEARKAAKLTQAELSAKLELPQSYVSKYERGERRLDVIEFLQVAQVLEIDPLAFIEELVQHGLHLAFVPKRDNRKLLVDRRQMYHCYQDG